MRNAYTSQANKVHQQNMALDTVDQAKNSGVSIHGHQGYIIPECQKEKTHHSRILNIRPHSATVLSQRGNASARTQKLTTMKK